MKHQKTTWNWQIAIVAALFVSLVGSFTWADEDKDEYKIQNGTICVEYDAEDGDLEIDNLADMKIVAQSVTQTANELTLNGVTIAPGITATLRVKLEANSPWVQFCWEYTTTGDVSALAKVRLLTIELDDNDDAWEASLMNIANATAGEKTVLTVAAKANNAGFVAGWKAGAGEVSTAVVEKDVEVTLYESFTIPPKASTFVIGKFLQNVQDGVSAF